MPFQWWILWGGGGGLGGQKPPPPLGSGKITMQIGSQKSRYAPAFLKRNVKSRDHLKEIVAGLQNA